MIPESMTVANMVRCCSCHVLIPRPDEPMADYKEHYCSECRKTEYVDEADIYPDPE